MKLIVNPFPTYKGILRRYDSSPEGWAYKPDRLASLSYYSVPRKDCDWLLVLRGVDDEASLSLAAGAICNRMTHLFLGILLPSLFWMFASVNLVGWIFGADWGILGLVGLHLTAIIATILFFLPGCFRSVFGRELLFGCWRCEIFADSAPDTTVGLRVKTFLRAGSDWFDLRHALYKNPGDCVRTRKKRAYRLGSTCNLYSITTNQAAIAALFRVVNRYVGNLAPMPGVFPDYPAPVIRNSGDEREMTMMRWGMPPPPRTGGPPVTNIRNTSSPHWRMWLKPENRCLVPFNSFAEYAPEANPETRKKDVVWFAINDDRPLTCFAGIWTEFTGDRGTKSKPIPGPNADVGASIPRRCWSF